LVGFITFGDSVFIFSSYVSSLNNITRMILGEAAFDELQVISPQFVWVYLLFFIFVFVYLLPALFLAVVLEGFRLAFNSSDYQQRSSFWELIKKQSNSEVCNRLKAWKERKSNENAEFISWAQLRDVLRGQVHNKMDISDEQVDEVFRLVKVQDYVSAETKASTEHSTLASESNIFLVPQLVQTMLGIKADEREFLKKMGTSMKTLRKMQGRAEDIIRRADAASNKYVKDDGL